MDLRRMSRARTLRAVAHLLVVLLVHRGGAAHAAGSVLWVDTAGSCGGATPCFTTIQAAIDAAGPGDTVRVLAGEYGEQLLVSGKNADPAATEASRITIEADPAAPVGAVRLRGAHDACQRGAALTVERSRFVTLRGFDFVAAGKKGIVVRGGGRANEAIEIVSNRLDGGSGRECLGGIDVAKGNPNTVIASNVIARVRRQGLKLRNKTGPVYVVGNTILHNESNGIVIPRVGRVAVWNNIVFQNGFRLKDGKRTRKYGVKVPKPPKTAASDDIDIRNNLICGNAGGEIQKPPLDAADSGNLTPTGAEGAGTAASPSCGTSAAVFRDLDGSDDVIDTADDDFALAVGSPALDRGIDPRAQGASIADAVFEADYLIAGVRPGGLAFDVGAVEIPGPAGTPTPGGPTRTQTPGGPGGTPTRTLPAPTPTATQGHIVTGNDHYEVQLGHSVTIAAPGVLGNDLDQLGHPLTATKLSDPSKGTLTSFGADGGFTYDAPATYAASALQPVVRFHNPTGQQGTVHRVIDVNGDGKPDVVFHGANRFLGVLDGVTGNFIWGSGNFGIPAPDTDCAIDTLARQLVVGDIDDDGVPEIVQPVRCARDGSGVGDRYVFINARTGAVERITDPLSANPGGTHGIAIEALPMIARLAPGEPPSLIVGTPGEQGSGNCSLYVAGAPGTGNYCRVVVIVDGSTGKVKRGMFALGAGGEATRDGPGNHQKVPPIVVDLDGDGVLEIVYAGAVFHQDGTVAWEWPTGVFRTAVANLDDTPDVEVLMVTALLNGHLDGLHAFKANGEELWSFPLNDTNIYGYIGVADVDRDGFPDILLTAFDYGANRDFLLVLDREGQVKWLHYFPVTPPQVSLTGDNNRPAVYDLDDDGVPEVIVQTDHDLWFLDGTNGQTETTFHYSTGGGGKLTLIPTVADLDGNGHAEVVFQSGFTPGNDNDGGLWVLKGVNDDWRPVQGIDNQLSHYGGNTAGGVAGAIPYLQTNPFATPRTNVFGMQAEWPYLPTFVGRDQTTFKYEATDGTLAEPAQVTIDILPTNRPPHFTSTAPTAYTVNQPFTYNAVAVDPDAGDTITYSILVKASDYGGFCSIGATSGVFTCTNLGAANTYVTQTFTLVATDSQGAIASQVLALVPSSGVAAVPNVVGLQQAAAQTAITGAGFTVGVVNSVQSPFPAGQVITQSPMAGRKAKLNSAVRLAVSLGPPPDPRDVDDDGDGYTENQGDCDDALPARNPGAADTVGNAIDENCDGVDGVLPIASIVVTPANDLIVTGNDEQYTATAILTDGTSADVTSVVVWNSSAPGTATIATTGVAHGVAVGTTTISATRSGFTGSTSLSVFTRSIGDQTDPTAIITTPASGSEVTTGIDVIGTADDATFLKYELAVAPAGETTFTTIATGTSPVTNGVLGTLDPTLLLNDLYDLKLTVYDRADNQASTITTVQVARQKKIGLFSITYRDLEVAVAGIPIVVTRTYDSRDKGRGDFGVGWRLGVQTLRIRANREQGSGWVVNHPSGLSFQLAPTAEHIVSLTLADGRVESFDLRVTPTSSFGQPFSIGLVASYVPRAGTLGTLVPLDNPHLMIVEPQTDPVNPVLLLDDTNLNTFNPALFRYTSPTGEVIDIGRLTGVERIQDPNGNAITFGASGITHSSGKSIAFVRDAAGRITQITDPAGNVQTYAYDARGDLVRHVDAVGTSRWGYDLNHGLIDIQDAAGNHAVRNEYEPDGRLAAMIDAAGNRIELTHDLGVSQEIVTDRLGNPTIFDYDAAGNVVASTDALGHLTTFTYDGRGNQLSVTDAVGRTATKTYDAFNNELTSTDFDGNVTTRTYNARQQVLTTTDDEGRTTTNVYDSRGNLTQTTNPDGGVTQSTYSPTGNRLTTTDPLGHTTTFGYDAFGNQTSATSPLGFVTTYTYDANGRQKTETDAAGTTTYAYDGKGRITSTTDERGGVSTQTHDPVGDGARVATSTDQRGKVKQYAYDSRGNRTGTTLPVGGADVVAYDAESRVLHETDREGHATTYERDALGRVTKTTYQDGTFTRMSYDAVGRVATETDARGHVSTHTYAPNRETVTDALAHATVTDFDSQRRAIATTDALGHATTFAYDGAGNQTVVTFHNATNKTTSHDAAKRKIAETDQEGRTTHFAYDLDGRLTSVTDAAGGVTSYTYDAVGNRLTATDANTHTTAMTYDASGHVLARTRPLGQQESFTYDAAGNQVTHTDFNGQTTTLVYDGLNRQVSRTLPGGSPVIVTAYDDNGRRTQAGGDTAAYDTRGRMTQETKATAEVLAYAYDAAGDRTSVTTPQGTTTYTFDNVNRLATVVDASGTTTYGYDAVGNLASTAYANGTSTAYTYDALNRLTQVVNSGPGGVLSSYVYTLGAAGERRQVVEAGSAVTARTVVYGYDVLYRLTSEQIDEAGTANDENFTYVYDAVGNRTQLDRNGLVVTSTYDANDRLLTEASTLGTRTSTYDANGNLATRSDGVHVDTYTWDAENRLASANMQSGGSPGFVAYTYDADGIRTSQTVGGTPTTFLADKNRAHAQVLVETTAGTPTTYVYGHHLISQRRTGTTRFRLTDGQLSTRQLTDAAGAVSDKYTYDAFGIELDSDGTTTNRYRYTGEQLDPNLGLYYLRARYYDQSSGRFASTDPVLGSVTDPMSLHRYVYAGDDPVDFLDPSGKSELGMVVAVNGVASTLTQVGTPFHVPASSVLAKINPVLRIDMHFIQGSATYFPSDMDQRVIQRMHDAFSSTLNIIAGIVKWETLQAPVASIDGTIAARLRRRTPVFVLVSDDRWREPTRVVVVEGKGAALGGFGINGAYYWMERYAVQALGKLLKVETFSSVNSENYMKEPPGDRFTDVQLQNAVKGAAAFLKQE